MDFGIPNFLWFAKFISEAFLARLGLLASCLLNKFEKVEGGREEG